MTQFFHQRVQRKSCFLRFRATLLTRIFCRPFQMHPLGLCNNNDEEDLYEYGWVGVVKLEQPELDPSCLTVLGKVKNNNPKHSHSYNRMGQSILMDLGLINEERLPSLLQKWYSAYIGLIVINACHILHIFISKCFPITLEPFFNYSISTSYLYFYWDKM